jgi:predicted TPR repeat methyltransferase
MPVAMTQRSSGDLLADRRHGYAQDSFDAGDHGAAAELATQALEIAPRFVPALALLGRAKAALGDDAGAVAALRQALAIEPEDSLGVRLDLARLGAAPPEEAITPGYVRALFDDYAPRFEKHLVKNLNYRGPELIAAAARRVAARSGLPVRFRRVLDLGCGTGLMAGALEGMFDAIEGVDLSPKMLAQAKRARLYDALHEADLASFLKAMPDRAADLVVAADVLVYLAALDDVFRETCRVLTRGGLFAFSVQAQDGEGFVLGEDNRYAHGEGYLRRLAAEAGFEVALLDGASTREDRGKPVPGFVVVLGRRDR